jgi:hypothetical protein
MVMMVTSTLSIDGDPRPLQKKCLGAQKTGPPSVPTCERAVTGALRALQGGAG